jgi:hypothetical protein
MGCRKKIVEMAAATDIPAKATTSREEQGTIKEK